MQAGSSATIRTDLNEVVKENMYGMGDFIGLNAMPLRGVTAKSGTFGKINFAQQPTEATVKRAPGAGYSRQIREATTDTYTCEEYGREESVDDSEKENLSGYFDAEQDAAASATGVIMGEQEARLADILFDTTTNFLSYKTDGTDWSTVASGTPIDDIRTALQVMKEQINGSLNGARLVALCHDTLANQAVATTQVRNALNLGQNGFATRDAGLAALAAATGLDAIYASSIQWDGDDVWAKTKFGIYVVSDGGTQSVPQVGRTFMWTSDCADNALVESYRDEPVRSDVVRVRQNVDEKLFTARAGHILYGLTS
jgi:hypothetical protein